MESPEEVLDALAPQLWPLATSLPLETFNEEEQGMLDLFSKNPLTLDQAAKKTKRPISLVASLLTRLELKRALRKRADGRFEYVR